ncbi:MULTISPECIES: response regulator [Staphylococcus]|uniref:Response regulator transcription factor n=3 Tax=Staphylococcus hominis TaxID=1290 RepID=A0A4Q9WQY1_STAHO|nr:MULTISPECIES: response regulator transcription factor [Staphylococcus]EUZ67588.1 DNA-binding response regulator [Staphylococcus sp. M0480]OFK81390.1 DNA-binding response regulator [Staphylococcus sp. HMSC057A02]OFM61122.1 DNA-binding response regulator [Staphylococcus sp. HMSC059G05]OFM63018.1 DNA-binding response regulator [Staphylococcus sp. HMSC062C01]OFM63329.1 DNA-binding response regulator [Staphylococcus sp. HMSC068D07]OFM75768.1 DNA-binding response regulator [Staphylococcus sp. HM
MASIVLIDDHHIVRQGLEFLISTVEGLDIQASFSDGDAFIKYLNENNMPDLVLLDLVMPKMNGIEVTHYIKKYYPYIKVLVLTSYVDDEYVMSAINEGADGYEIKDVEPQKLIATITKVLNNEKIIHPKAKNVIDAMHEKPHFNNKLSKREMEVLKEMVKGKTNKDIAKSLFVSEKTVKTHVSHIFNKLQVSDRTQAAIYAIENKLI